MRLRPFAEIVSIERIRMWIDAPDDNDGRPHLARAVLTHLEAGDADSAAEAFLACLPDYFYNMSPAQKRRYADAITIVFCNCDEDRDELFEWMKKEKVTGRTWVPRDRS